MLSFSIFIIFGAAMFIWLIPLIYVQLQSFVLDLPRLFNEFLKRNKLNNSLIISDKNSTSKIVKSARNIQGLKIIDQEGTNAYDLLKFKNVIFPPTVPSHGICFLYAINS